MGIATDKKQADGGFPAALIISRSGVGDKIYINTDARCAVSDKQGIYRNLCFVVAGQK